MIIYEYIVEAQDFLVKHWEEDGKAVIVACYHAKPYNGTFKQFLHEWCSPCGGNWGAMILNGIHECWPEVWEKIPDNMGIFSWTCLIYVLLLCGVDTSAE